MEPKNIRLYPETCAEYTTPDTGSAPLPDSLTIRGSLANPLRDAAHLRDPTPTNGQKNPLSASERGLMTMYATERPFPELFALPVATRDSPPAIKRRTASA